MNRCIHIYLLSEEQDYSHGLNCGAKLISDFIICILDE